MCCVFCKVLLSIVASQRVMLCFTHHGGFGVWVPEGKRNFSVFQNVQPTIHLIPGALSGGIQNWVREADASPYLVPRCRYATILHGLVLLHTGSVALFPFDFVFFHTELHTVQSLFCLCKSLAVVCQLHLLSSSLWNWYNKFVNDWCIFGEVWVNILSCVLSSKLYKCRFSRETNVLMIAGSYLLTPHSAFHFRFFSCLKWRIYSAENLPIYQTTRHHTSEGISFPLCTLMILIG
jgi:hypothetical protein